MTRIPPRRVPLILVRDVDLEHAAPPRPLGPLPRSFAPSLPKLLSPLAPLSLNEVPRVQGGNSTLATAPASSDEVRELAEHRIVSDTVIVFSVCMSVVCTMMSGSMGHGSPPGERNMLKNEHVLTLFLRWHLDLICVFHVARLVYTGITASPLHTRSHNAHPAKSLWRRSKLPDEEDRLSAG
jgi:hypothetical protein